MKKTFFLSLSLFLCFSSLLFSQEEKKVQLQVRGGLNISSLVVSSGGRTESEKSKIGYNFGVVADISLGKKFYFQPGLSLTAKGSKLRDVEIDLNSTRVDLSMNALYLQVPLYFAYKLNIPSYPQNKLGIVFGPYVAYGVGGSITGPIPGSIDTFGDDGFCNSPDVGIGMEIQFEMPKVVFIWGSDLGFTKVIKSEFISAVTPRNQNVYFGAGYKF